MLGYLYKSSKVSIFFPGEGATILASKIPKNKFEMTKVQKRKMLRATPILYDFIFEVVTPWDSNPPRTTNKESSSDNLEQENFLSAI